MGQDRLQQTLPFEQIKKQRHPDRNRETNPLSGREALLSFSTNFMDPTSPRLLILGRVKSFYEELASGITTERAMSVTDPFALYVEKTHGSSEKIQKLDPDHVADQQILFELIERLVEDDYRDPRDLGGLSRKAHQIIFVRDELREAHTAAVNS